MAPTHTGKLKIAGPQKMAAMASSARLEIVDVLEHGGPITLREIGEQLGRPADALYYHIRELKAAGIVIELPPRESGGGIQVDLAGRPVELDYNPADPDNRNAVVAIVRAMLRNAERRFTKAFVPRQKDGRARSMWTGRGQGRLTEADLREINGHIDAILEIMQDARQRNANTDAALHDFTCVICPVER